MKPKFKVGDRVYAKNYGLGTITNFCANYACVAFDSFVFILNIREEQLEELPDLTSPYKTDLSAVPKNQCNYIPIPITYMPTAASVSEPPARCWHEWKHYQGFTENYDYCTKCDAKRPHQEVVTETIETGSDEYFETMAKIAGSSIAGTVEKA